MNIRPVRPEEIDAARVLVPAGHAEPNWNNAWVIEEDGQLVGVMGAQLQLVAEPLYVKPGHKAAALMGMGYLDAKLGEIAKHFNVPGYSFFIGDDHPDFQKFVASFLPVTPGREKPGLYFFRSF